MADPARKFESIIHILAQQRYLIVAGIFLAAALFFGLMKGHFLRGRDRDR